MIQTEIYLPVNFSLQFASDDIDVEAESYGMMAVAASF